MKKCLIVKNSFNDSENYLYQINRLKEEFIKLDVQVDIFKTSELQLIIENCVKIKNEWDFIVFFDKDTVFSRAFEKLGLPVFNSSEAIEFCDNKMLTHVALSNNNIRMPKTIPGLLCYSFNKGIDLDYVSKIEKYLGFPMIFKESYGSLGKNVYLVKDHDELLKYVDKFKLTSYLFQEYIESSYGKDVRVILVGNEVVGTMLRKNDTNFRSNIGYGGTGYNYKAKKSFLDMAVKVSKILKLDYCGIDLLFGKDGEPYLCEVNSNAFFHEFEVITKINVAEKYCKYIYNKVYNKK